MIKNLAKNLRKTLPKRVRKALVLFIALGPAYAAHAAGPADQLVEAGQAGSLVTAPSPFDHAAVTIALGPVLAELATEGVKVLNKKIVDGGAGTVWALEGPFGFRWFLTAYRIQGTHCHSLQLNAVFKDDRSDRPALLERVSNWTIRHRFVAASALGGQRAVLELDVPPGASADVVSGEIRQIWIPALFDYQHSAPPNM